MEDMRAEIHYTMNESDDGTHVRIESVSSLGSPGVSYDVPRDRVDEFIKEVMMFRDDPIGLYMDDTLYKKGVPIKDPRDIKLPYINYDRH